MAEEQGRPTGGASSTKLVILASFWIATVWIGADMYLPALPVMKQAFGASEALVNMTLMAYTLALPVGALIGGPFSDKCGRRIPTLVGGSFLVIGNALCSCAPSIGFLMAVRLFAGLGGGVITATAMVILDDLLEGQTLERAVTTVQSFAIVGPVVAPFLGSLMLQLGGWRQIFVLLALFSFVCAVLYLGVGESLPVAKRAQQGLLGSLALVFHVARDAEFSVLLAVLCLPALAFGAFMTVCSYVYIDHFGLSYLQYSVLYSTTSIVSIMAPFVYARLHRHMGNRRIIDIVLVLMLVSGAWVLALGDAGPWAFAAGCVPFALAEGMGRPCAYLVLLRAKDGAAGSASALINFAVGMLTGLGTPLASLPWPTHIVAMGVITLAAGVVSTVLFVWLVGVRKSRMLDE